MTKENIHCFSLGPGNEFTRTQFSWAVLALLLAGFLRVPDLRAQALIPGALTRELFSGPTGEGQMALFLCKPEFPDSPDMVDELSEFRAPVDMLDFYGQRLWGFLRPKETADYIFYLSSDDQGYLFLSPDENPAHKTLIAFEPYASSPADWTAGRYPPGANVSFPIHLEAGRAYYLEGLMREYWGGDHLSVAWRKTTDPIPVKGTGFIRGEFLARTDTPLPALEKGPPMIPRLVPSDPGVGPLGVSVLVNQQSQFTLWEGAPLTIGCYAAGAQPLAYQWYFQGQAVGGATNRTWTIPQLASHHTGAYRVEVKNAEGSATSEATQIAVRRAELLAGPIKNPTNDRYYYLLGHSPWLAAEAAAVRLGGHLATIRNAQLQSWVYSTFGHYAGVNRDLWIGLRDPNPRLDSPDLSARRNEFTWVSGEPRSYSNWAPSEPNNPGTEHYVHLFRPTSDSGFPGKWNNATIAYDQAYGVVEVVSESVGSLVVTDFRVAQGIAEITWNPPYAKVIVEEFAGLTFDPVFRASTGGEPTNRLSFILPDAAVGFYRLHQGLEAADITDPKLYVAVLKLVGDKIPPGNQLYDQDVLPITALKISALGISSLEGLQHARLLETLNAGQNLISDISWLAGLLQLSVLDLSDNLVVDLEPLTADTGLRELNLSNNRIEDISVLSKLRGLATLYLQGNEIDDASVLTNLTALRSLNLANNLLREIEFVRPLSVLSSANFEGNILSDLSPVAGLRNLESLVLNGCINIYDLAPLANLFNLNSLHLANNRLTDVGPLAKLTKMRWLNLDGNRLLDIGPLSNLKAIQWLNLNNNRVVDISPLAGLTNLADGLGLINNRIANVQPLAKLIQLRSLDLSANYLADISTLSNLTSLTWLALPNNRIGDVSPLAPLTRLDYLDLNGNAITNLSSLTNLVNLRSLHLSGNQIQSVPACTQMLKLNELNLSNNKLTEISALVTNAILGGLGAGDNVYLGGNPLNSQGQQQVGELRKLGVSVSYP